MSLFVRNILIGGLMMSLLVVVLMAILVEKNKKYKKDFETVGIVFGVIFVCFGVCLIAYYWTKQTERMRCIKNIPNLVDEEKIRKRLRWIHTFEAKIESIRSQIMDLRSLASVGDLSLTDDEIECLNREIQRKLDELARFKTSRDQLKRLNEEMKNI